MSNKFRTPPATFRVKMPNGTVIRAPCANGGICKLQHPLGAEKGTCRCTTPSLCVLVEYDEDDPTEDAEDT